MMWTLIVIGLAFLVWRYMGPVGAQEAPAAAEAPPPPPAAEPAAAGEDPFVSPEPPKAGGSSRSPSPSGGEVDPFKAPGS